MGARCTCAPSRDGKRLIAITKLGRFKAFLRTRGERLPGAADLQTAQAKASLAGHRLEFGAPDSDTRRSAASAH
jgi:hypothetical protein